MAPGRRSVLRSLATVGVASVCGCASGERDPAAETPTVTALPVETDEDSRDQWTPVGDDGDGEDDDYYPEPTPMYEPSAMVSLGSIQGDESPVAYDLEVVEAVATPETPPLLAVEATNTADRPIGVGETRALRFWAARAGHDAHHLVLLPLEYGGSIAFMDGQPSGEGSCWQLDSRVVQTTEYRFATLQPGESIGSELAVWWQGPVDTCFPTGAFAFATDYEVWDPEGGREPGDGDRYSFGFTLDVERP